ncbi:MAG: acetate kinase [Bacteroidales bacterium]|nr:acetate kinase [Bacteroidales bacterium]
MKILVLNCGSSSLKYKLIDMENKTEMAQGGVEKIGLEGSFLKFTKPNGEKVVLNHDMPEHQSAIEFVLDVLASPEHGAVKSLDEIDAVGHRVVHGGEKFSESVLITDEVMNKIVECIEVAPLHNPPNIAGIKAIEELIPGKPQVAVFDTAFHQSMPAEAYMYALPYRLYKDYGVRRYGFHGTSHRYVSQRACDFLGVKYEDQKIISCHIGNGASVTAIKNGKSVDTSMGFTPTEGLVMGTRSGDVDPGALAFIMEKEGLDAKGLSDLVNKKSGVFGVSEISSDMRDIENGVNNGDPRCILTMNMYDYRIKKYVGAYAAAMGGVDIIIFTGGAGENQCTTRKAVCEGLEFMGVEFDADKNKGLRGKEAVLSKPGSRVKVVVIPTDEETMIASDTENIVSALK